MAELAIGGKLLGGSAGIGVQASGFVAAVGLGALVVLAWHYWDRDDSDDKTAWHDPEQPPLNTDLAMLREAPGPHCRPSWFDSAMRGRRYVGSEPGAI